MKKKPLFIGAGIGFLAGLLLMGWLICFGLCPALSVLNLPAICLLTVLPSLQPKWT